MKRRAMLTVIPGAIAATAVPAIAAAIPQVEPRSEILDLYSRWCAAEAVCESESDLRGDGDETPKERAAAKQAEELRVQLLHCQPSTMPEVAALAHILWSSLSYQPDEAERGIDYGSPMLIAAIWRGASGREGVPGSA